MEMGINSIYGAVVIIGVSAVVCANAFIFGVRLLALTNKSVNQTLSVNVPDKHPENILIDKSGLSAMAQMCDGSIYLVFVNGDHVNSKEISSATIHRIVNLNSTTIRFRFRGLSVASRTFAFPDCVAAAHWRLLLTGGRSW